MKKKNIATFLEAENYINDTPRFTSKNTMEDTRAFLHRLGDPDRKMRIIHVAGTNGKALSALICGVSWRLPDTESPCSPRLIWYVSESVLWWMEK